jgi:hypothetical protein
MVDQPNKMANWDHLLGEIGVYMDGIAVHFEQPP